MVASIAIRIVHATGNAMVLVTTFNYGATSFDKSVSKVFVRSVKIFEISNYTIATYPCFRA